MLDTPVYMAYLCCSGSHGYTAMMEVLEGGTDATHMLLATNVDVRDMSELDYHRHDDNNSSTPVFIPSSIYTGTPSLANLTTAVSVLFSSPLVASTTASANRLWGGGVRVTWEDRIGPSCTHISILGRPPRTTPALLSGCSSLHSVVLEGFRELDRVDESFLSGCIGLFSIDLSPLCNITTIEASFMFGCSGLRSIDLTPLQNVTVIHRSFLQKCSGLEEIDLSPLDGKVVTVGWSFMAECTSLKFIDIAPLKKSSSRLTDWSLLQRCSGLSSIDLSPLSNITSVGHSFLSSCSGLTSLDLSPLSNVASIGNEFLSYCSSLEELDVNGLRNVEKIGSMFLYECSGLESIDLTPLVNVRSIDRPILSSNGTIPKLIGFEKLQYVLKAALM